MIDKSYQQSVINQINESAAATLPLIIKDLIEQNSAERDRLETNWVEYKGDVPIKFKPRLSNRYAPDHRPVHAFRNLIVSEKTGYLTGVPIKYSYPDDPNTEEMINNFLKVNNYESLDANTITYLAATGKAYRLLYITKNFVTQRAEVRMANQLPWECIVITDSTLDNFPVYGMIYYQVQVQEAKGPTWHWKVEWYDKNNVYYFIENENNNFVPDDSYFNPIEAHGFGIMPLIEFNNNILKFCDYELVKSLINSYDEAVAFALNDNATVSNALMIFKDVPLTQTLIDQATYLRGIQIDSSPQKPNPEVSYLSKDIQIQTTETLCNQLEENIFKFSSTVDIYSDAFSGGTVSGESRKQQLIPLELKCKETERLFQYSMRQLFNVIATYWKAVFNINLVPEDIDFIFTRSIIPTEYTLDQIVQLLNAGLISKETAMSKIPFIDNPADEMAKIQDEEAGNLDNTTIDDSTTNEGV